MDRPSMIMLCKVVPGIGFKVTRFLGFGDEFRILERFQESRFHGARAVAHIKAWGAILNCSVGGGVRLASDSKADPDRRERSSGGCHEQ
jgi:hypothetical protein